MKMLFSNPLLLTWLIAFSIFTVYSLPKFLKKNTMEYKFTLTTFIVFLFSASFLVFKFFAPQVLIIPSSIINFLGIFANVAIFFFFCLVIMLPGTIAKFSDKKALKNLIINILFFIILIMLLVIN